jgi:hypothetical protein
MWGPEAETILALNERGQRPKKSTAPSGGTVGFGFDGDWFGLSGPLAATTTTRAVRRHVVPVDGACPKYAITHVYSASAMDVYDCMLNQTNIGNNNNKFFILQLLESNEAPMSFYVWTRWSGHRRERWRVRRHSGESPTDISHSSMFACDLSCSGVASV